MSKTIDKIKEEANLRKQTFFDITYDPVLKKVFQKKSTLVHFLNTFLRLENDNRITQVEQLKRKVRLYDANGGFSTGGFDIHARTADGCFVDIEVQRLEHDDFLDRVEFYGSLLSIKSKITMDSEASKRLLKEHPYLMPTVYSIWLCNFKVPFCNDYREDLGLFRFSDLGNMHALPIYAKKRYIVIDITRYVPSSGNDLEHQWLEIFKLAAKKSRIPRNVAEEIRDVYERLMVNGSTEDFLRKVVNSMTDKKEYWACLSTARRKGEAEGLAKGEARWLVKGEAKAKKKFAARDKKIMKFLRSIGVSAEGVATAFAIK